MKKTVITVLFVLAVGGAVVVLLAEHGYSITAMLQPPEVSRDFEAMLAKERPAEDSPERLLSRQMAKKIKTRYENMKFLSFDAEVYEVPAYMKATAEVTMRPGFYTTKASFDGQLVWELMFKEGKAYEHKLPYRGVIDQRLTYPVEQPDGPGNISLVDGIPFHMGCMIGSCLCTWVGPDADHILLMVRRLEEGWYVRKENVDGISCRVFLWKHSRLSLAFEYYIDENYLLRQRRKYTLSHDRKRTVHIAIYHHIVAKGEKGGSVGQFIIDSLYRKND